MSKSEPRPESVVRLKPVREPQQGRSRASFERMLAAAQDLMIERGSDDFTLNEVARHGAVSIGSIYNRFDSKDDLIHAVQSRVMDEVDGEILSGIARARAGAEDLENAVDLLVETLAESLRRFANRLRPLMQRASSDPIVADVGKRSYLATAQSVQDALLSHVEDIRHPDPARAAEAAFRILYAALARHLGFGLASEAIPESDWTNLKSDLAHMTAAFLSTPPRGPAPDPA